eukprot:2886411-Rhodomonas_salina.2
MGTLGPWQGQTHWQTGQHTTVGQVFDSRCTPPALTPQAPPPSPPPSTPGPQSTPPPPSPPPSTRTRTC